MYAGTHVKGGGILQENALSFQVHEQLTTAQVFKDQIKFSLRLESVDEVHDERMLHSLQDIAFGFGMSRVLLIANYSSFLQYFHCINFAFIFAAELSYLKHFPIATFTENFAQFEIWKSQNHNIFNFTWRELWEWTNFFSTFPKISLFTVHGMLPVTAIWQKISFDDLIN